MEFAGRFFDFTSTSQRRHFMNAYRRIPGVLFMIGLLCLAVTAGFGQVLTGQLTGIVTDQSGAVIPSANITLKNQLSGDIRKTVSNSEGVFAFAAVPTGDYSVTIEAQGFAKWERSGVKLSAGDAVLSPTLYSARRR